MAVAIAAAMPDSAISHLTSMQLVAHGAEISLEDLARNHRLFDEAEARGRHAFVELAAAAAAVLGWRVAVHRHERMLAVAHKRHCKH